MANRKPRRRTGPFPPPPAAFWISAIAQNTPESRLYPRAITFTGHIDPRHRPEEIRKDFGLAVTDLLYQQERHEKISLLTKILNLTDWIADRNKRLKEAERLQERLENQRRRARRTRKPATPQQAEAERLIAQRIRWYKSKVRPPKLTEIRQALKNVYGIDVELHKVKAALYKHELSPRRRPKSKRFHPAALSLGLTE